MLTEAQRQHFRELQQKEDEGILSVSEREELQALIQIIEDAETVYLRPATERIRQERFKIAEQNRALEALIQRKERLARRLERILSLSLAEREKINAEVAAILNTNTTRVTG